MQNHSAGGCSAWRLTCSPNSPPGLDPNPEERKPAPLRMKRHERVAVTITKEIAFGKMSTTILQLLNPIARAAIAQPLLERHHHSADHSRSVAHPIKARMTTMLRGIRSELIPVPNSCRRMSIGEAAAVRNRDQLHSNLSQHRGDSRFYWMATRGASDPRNGDVAQGAGVCDRGASYGDSATGESSFVTFCQTRFPLCIVTATLSVPFFILGEVALSFLGVGIPAPGGELGEHVDRRAEQPPAE